MLVTAGMAFAPIGILAAGATIVFKRATSIAARDRLRHDVRQRSGLPDQRSARLAAVDRAAMPTWFAFEGLRSALFEGGGWYGDAAALLLFAAVALPCSVWLLSASLTKARRDGTLGQY